jgi:hypothetical protein
MSWLFRKGRRDSAWRDSGFLGAGHYPIPVLEETLGLASSAKVIFNRDPSEVWRLVELTFTSIRSANTDVTNEVVAEMKAQQYKDVGNRLGNLQDGYAL